MHDLDKLRPVRHKRYLVAFYPEHPNAWASSKLIYWHRLVMENHLGRYLEAGEQVHHKDEDPLNNVVDNLEVLSRESHGHKHRGFRQIKLCAVCRAEFMVWKKTQRYCSPKCSQRGQDKIKWPSTDELKNLVWSMPTMSVAALLGVSDVAIAKRCKRLGIDKPGRGYWQKKQSNNGV